MIPYECLFCLENSEDLDEIVNHMRKTHPGKIRLFGEMLSPLLEPLIDSVEIVERLLKES